MINRYELVNRHNPMLNQADYESPMTVGNGEFAFTADVTGMQTLYSEYKENHAPLCTMSQWGWHTEPAGAGRDTFYTAEDLQMTEYDCAGRKVTYAVLKKKGNEEVYDWLRQNPHRLNLARIAFTYEGKEIAASDIGGVCQILKLYEGKLESSFIIHGYPVEVLTVCHRERDGLAFSVRSHALGAGKLKVSISFPYGSPDITASDWNAQDRHATFLQRQPETGSLCLRRQLDRDHYYVAIRGDAKARIHTEETVIAKQSDDGLYINAGASGIKDHKVTIGTDTGLLEFTVLFSREEDTGPLLNQETVLSSRNGWRSFWETGAAIDLHRSKDNRAMELERRIILSQYLLAVQSCGSMPPQETGLTCNSWYGKFHLEMHLWHSAWLPLWNRAELLARSLEWYKKTLPKAKSNAARNGYKGAKWPKMVAHDGIDSPSAIATLLIWQQPHIIYLLELIYQSYKREASYNKVLRVKADIKESVSEEPFQKEDVREKIISGESFLKEAVQADIPNNNLNNSLNNYLLARKENQQEGKHFKADADREDFLKEYWELIYETAEYMCDLAVYNPAAGCYDLPSPLIPAQEEHDPRQTRNPAFELEYWAFALKIAIEWAGRLGYTTEHWRTVAEHMAELPQRDGLYLAHENCPLTYEEFHRDHPSMLGVLGLLPGYRADPAVVEKSLEKVLKCWDFSTMWGWDFALMAMTAVRLGKPELAIDILMKDAPKNSYVKSGNNYQRLRRDLPLYLPGNGSLLLTVSLMAAGYGDNPGQLTGFPDNGMWEVEAENMNPFPY